MTDRSTDPDKQRVERQIARIDELLGTEPPDRSGLVEALHEQIRSGRYDSDKKLGVALDRMMKDLTE